MDLLLKAIYALLFISLLPNIYLFVLFSIICLVELFDRICKAVFNYTLICVMFIISNPIIVIGLLIYLYMTIRRFTAI